MEGSRISGGDHGNERRGTMRAQRERLAQLQQTLSSTTEYVFCMTELAASPEKA
jgi:hypothetical protein